MEEMLHENRDLLAYEEEDGATAMEAAETQACHVATATGVVAVVAAEGGDVGISTRTEKAVRKTRRAGQRTRRTEGGGEGGRAGDAGDEWTRDQALRLAAMLRGTMTGRNGGGGGAEGGEGEKEDERGTAGGSGTVGCEGAPTVLPCPQQHPIARSAMGAVAGGGGVRGEAARARCHCRNGARRNGLRIHTR